MINLAGKKGLIIKLRYIGDTLSIAPVVDNFKEKVPDAIVDVMVNKGTEEVLAYHPGIRRLWTYDRHMAKKDIISSIVYHRRLIRLLRGEKYDFVIDFTHGDRAAFLAFMTGSPERITYQESSILSRLLMNRVIQSDPNKHHIIDYQLQALRLFGLNTFKRNLKIHIPESAYQKIHYILSERGLYPEVVKVVIHPGARGRLRQWRPERFAEIALRLKEGYNAHIILIGGPSETDLIRELERHMGFIASFSSNDLTLIELAALLSKCSLFIGNDSAPAHLAAAVDCPNVTLFGPTFPHMWRPLSPVGEVVFKCVPCCGCRQESCIRPENNCMDLIQQDDVWKSVEKLLIPL
ncbi:MAG: putative lipopolysaccharide heptosyltransferase III [Pseudomonadota bacterium]